MTVSCRRVLAHNMQQRQRGGLGVETPGLVDRGLRLSEEDSRVRMRASMHGRQKEVSPRRQFTTWIQTSVSHHDVFFKHAYEILMSNVPMRILYQHKNTSTRSSTQSTSCPRPGPIIFDPVVKVREV
ncbi:hypothetical protein PM082_021835 [Marasmius tenuissimus]|nr:hypothetical protein PM082_021835 [Marasmius tenuissimus]